MSQTITRPQIDQDLETAKPGRVVLYNCDCHSFDDVETMLVLATRCSSDVAKKHAWTVHTQGRAIVYHAVREDCEKVAAVLRSTGLQVEVDWD